MPESVEQYIKSLPEDRRKDIERARKLVNRYLPKGYVERLAGKFITWDVPLEDYSGTYNKQPLAYIGLASQKNYNALYLTGCYMSPAQQKRLAAAYERAGRKLDMGKSCLRFGSFDELPVKTLGELIAEMKPAELIALHEKARKR